MMVRAAPPEHFAWLVERTGCAVTAGFRAIEAVDSGGIVRGMVGYDLWTENAVQAHMAVDTPIAWRALLRPAFAYPFEECGKGVILAVIPAGNAKSVHLAKRFGFAQVHRVRDGWALGEDLIMLEMRREECRWLGKEDMRRQTHPPRRERPCHAPLGSSSSGDPVAPAQIGRPALHASSARLAAQEEYYHG